MLVYVCYYDKLIQYLVKLLYLELIKYCYFLIQMNYDSNI